MASSTNLKNKKILENPILGSLVVPIAIVLIGALIIFGVTALLSSDRSSYKSLVREMHSKTFGNKWIASYELSKYIAAQKIPSEDIPWLITNLTDVYKSSIDKRTKKFIIVALGAVRDEKALSFFSELLQDQKLDSDLVFHIIAGIGNMPKGINFRWDDLFVFLNSDDPILRQSTLLVLGTHRVKSAIPLLQKALNDVNIHVRYSAALALGSFRDFKSFGILKEILLRAPTTDERPFTRTQLIALKLNVLDVVQKTKWNDFQETLEILIKNKNEAAKVVSMAREVLKQLIN